MRVSTLPVVPESAIALASLLSPDSMSAWADPDMPSIEVKRASTVALDTGTGVSSKARSSRSAVTPNGSSLKPAQSKPEPPS
ncbi:hypothetical protein D3C78_1562380 [compost metagenome]